MNIYDLSRHFWNYSFENPDKIKPQHSAIYFYAIEVCNRLGWKEKFGFPSAAAMEATGIKSHNTFTKRLNELVDMGLIKMIERSKNQYTANVIALSKFAKAHDKALDRHCIKHLTGTVQSTDSINKPINNSTNTPINNSKSVFSFRQSLIDYGFEEQLVDDWLKVRKKTGGTNTKTALKMFIGQVEQLEVDINELMAQIVYKGWRGFQANWVDKLDLPSLKRNKKDIPEKYQKDIDAALPYCDDWGISKEVKLWVSPDRDEPFVTLGGLSVWYFRSYASEYKSDLEHYPDKKQLADIWKRKIEEGLRETRGDTNKMTEL